MGWCSFRLDEPVKDWFVRLWENNGKYQVLDSALVKRMTLYAAVKNIETGEVYCAVYLVRWSRDYYNFSYKDMTEHAGPYVHDCPIRIFNLLSTLNDDNDPNGYAREWRKRVLEYHSNRNKLKGDCLIKVDSPIQFTNGGNYEYFKKFGKLLYAGIMEYEKFIPVIRVRLNIHNFKFQIL